MRQFVDPALQAHFDREGYVVAPLFDASEVAWLSAEVARLCPVDLPPNNFDPYSYSSHSDPDRRHAVSELVKGAMAPSLSRMLTGCHITTGAVLQREPGAKRLPAHQHPPSTADFTDMVIICWCPLVDCDENSGALQVIPGSHQLLWHVKTPVSHAAWDGIADDLSDYLVTLNVRAGEAVFFAGSIIHGSCANQRAGTRVALISNINPEGAIPAFYVDSSNREGWIDIYRAQDEFAQSDAMTDTLPPCETWERLGGMPAGRVWLNRRQFEALLANGVQIAPGVDPFLAVAHLADPPEALPRPPLARLRRVTARYIPSRVKAHLRRLI